MSDVSLRAFVQCVLKTQKIAGIEKGDKFGRVLDHMRSDNPIMLFTLAGMLSIGSARLK